MPGYSLATIQYSEENGFEFLLSKPYRSGAYVTGAQKLVQNFAAELLTQRGSVRFDPTYGSRLPNELRGHNLATLDDIHGILARGLNDVVTNIRNRERPSHTPDEMLADAVIVDLRQELDRVIAAIEIHTEAGESLIVKFPMELTEGENRLVGHQ